MSDSGGASCALCLRRDETQRTGPLATKDEVTAHQNCLLFSSGLFCRNSPNFDDLFGFDVDDVLTEVKRGSKLICNKCKKKGATAGCEVKRCKKSYHYPCALQDGAHSVEDAAQGEFGLYCSNHYQQKTQSHDASVNGRPAPFTRCRPAKRASEPGPSEVYCPACKKTEGHISVDSLCRSIVVLLSQTRSCDTSDERQRGFDFVQATVGVHQRLQLLFQDRSDTDMDIFAPLDTDFGERNQVEGGRVDGNDEEDGGNDEEEGSILPSDAESESLLLPASRSPSARSAPPPPPLLPRVVLMKSPEAAAARRSDHGSSPADAPPSLTCSPPCTGSAISLPPPPLPPLAPPSPLAPPPDPDLGFHSTRFWKSCNAAGCTRALFAGFINEMNAVASRIQSDRASQEDYDHALTVMTASGKLEALVAQQQEELQRKQAELLTATGAMKEVVAALKTRVHQQAP
ncbi:PHD finger protein 6 [Liparis tanakae]|uniref:PHD finger protein 6 n=1 Tax=Liparis tanakae TaxID=230148 RepID=A0A4Z2GLJ0_9TELE|nr:PHD finger protein 6 [Liparis tanakae]